MSNEEHISQRDMINHLKSICPGLQPTTINIWCRKKVPFLKEDEHYIIRPGESGDKRSFKIFPIKVIPYIHRLYHYDQVRHFDNDKILASANFQNRQIFHVYFEQHPSNIPSTPLHAVICNALYKLDTQMDGIVKVKRAASVYGGKINAIALCECVDGHDLGMLLGSITLELRRKGTTARIIWQVSDKFCFKNQPKEEKLMKAFVIINVLNRVSNSTLDKLFKDYQSIDEVTSASLIYGDAEMLITVETTDLDTLTNVIAEKIRVSEGVTGTRTYIVMPGYDFVRLSAPS